jgi:hypothetical protein
MLAPSQERGQTMEASQRKRGEVLMFLDSLEEQASLWERAHYQEQSSFFDFITTRVSDRLPQESPIELTISILFTIIYQIRNFNYEALYSTRY